jgi:hypothetical protein
LSLAQQNDANKNQQAQTTINNTQVKDILTGYYNQMTKDTSEMSQMITAGIKTTDPQYQAVYKDWLKSNTNYNNTVNGYTSSLAGN